MDEHDIQRGDLLAVYLWPSEHFVFCNEECLVVSDEPAICPEVWLETAHRHGASLRFDAFATKARAIAEHTLDVARGELTAAILDHGGAPRALRAFADATRAAYGEATP